MDARFYATIAAAALAVGLSTASAQAGTFATGTYSTQFNTLGYIGGYTNDFNEVIIFGPNGAISTSFNDTYSNYDGVEDAVILVLNNSGTALTSFHMVGSVNGGGDFGFDGDGISLYLSPSPSNPYDTTTYGGANAYFTNIGTTTYTDDTGTVNFANGIANGGWDYFSLEQEADINSSSQVITPGNSVPEPGPLALVAVGFLGLGFARTRQNLKVHV